MARYGGVLLYTDGASRGNPGPSATSCIICSKDEEILKEGSEFIGIATNNQAEYRALITGLRCAVRFSKRVRCFLDSELVVKQLHGEYKVRNPALRLLYGELRELESEVKTVSYSHVPRNHAMIRRADKLVNRKLDELA